MFNNCGVIHIEKSKISEDEAFEVARRGAKDCNKINGYREIITAKEIFIKLR